jgi:beta-lactamase class D
MKASVRAGTSLALLIAALLFGGCSHAQKKTDTPLPFHGMTGCFLLYNLNSGSYEESIDAGDCRKPLPACSSFKVPLAVMAFDSGLLQSASTTIKWDGKKRSRDAENRDHNARTWMSESIVWYSQDIAKRMGRSKLQSYLDALKYGNRDLDGGPTSAWLVSPASDAPALKITAYEQVEFMKQLWTDALPVSKRAQKMARDLTFIETSPSGFRLSGKTGSNFYDAERTRHLGWFIAHLDTGKTRYIIVTNLSDLTARGHDEYGGMRARELTKKLLALRSLW